MTIKPTKESPVVDTLWQRCFWEVVERQKTSKNADVVHFKDVENVILEYAQLPINEMLERLSINNKPTVEGE